MRVRLIQVTTRRSGAKARKEETQEVETLSVGRGTQNQLGLQGLTISLHHATFHLRSGQVFVEPAVGAEVLRNGSPVAGEMDPVAPGDSLRIGQFELRCVEPESGEELALEIEEVERREEAKPPSVPQVESGWFTRRVLSWSFALLILLVFLAIPLLGSRFGIGDQSSWNSGTISRKHAFIANDCEACHGGFERVSNSGCLGCHGDIGNHARAEMSPASLDQARCASCHIEHAGSHGLADLDQTLCGECHANLASIASGTELGNASDFDDEHPDFRLHVVQRPGAENDAERLLLATWSPELRERSGVAFNHYRHVGQAVADPTGPSRHLRCDSCHQVDAGGKYMQPIEFGQHCQSCHRLSFDERFEDEAIHADLVAMRQDLTEKYARLGLEGEAVEESGAAVFNWARAGMQDAELSEDQARALFAWAEKRARQAERELTEGNGECARCHEFVDGAASDGGRDAAPVQIAEVWMPSGEFHHKTHAPFQCRECHPAAAVFDPESTDVGRPEWAESAARPYGLLTAAELAAAHPGAKPSESATDVLVLGIDSCQPCHGGGNARPPQVASECGLCHPFHNDYGKMSEREVAGAHGKTQPGAAPWALGRAEARDLPAERLAALALEATR